MNIQTVSYEGLTFLNVSRPTQFEIKYLRNNYGFNTLHLEDHLKRTEIPKLEVFKNYSLIVVDFPSFGIDHQNGTKEVPKKNGVDVRGLLKHIPQATLSSLPLPNFTTAGKKHRLFNNHTDLFIGKDYLVVIHDGNLPQIDHIFSVCQKTLRAREEYLGQGPVYLAYKVLDALTDGCFPIMNSISATIDKIDRSLEVKQTPSTLEEISITRRNVVVFHTMIKTIIPIFKKLEQGVHKELNGTMQSYWSNILDHLENILDRLEDSRELIEGISESNEFLLRSRTNEIMTVLTILFTLTIPVTVIGTFYGMNILLPGGIIDGSWTYFGPYTTFILVILASVIPIFFMLWYFKHRHWY